MNILQDRIRGSLIGGAIGDYSDRNGYFAHSLSIYIQ